ncbi:MAG: hypothetical protein GX248_06190 [Peptococcaceae bacterium]|nr:hypothetical protein [Peptococcaceae bacterium]
MCNVGDIIVIENFQHNGKKLGRHSFVVLSDDGGQIQGLDYDLICNIMSSFKDEKQKKKKLSFPGNFPIVPEDLETIEGNNKSGYIKAEQLYYFNKAKITFIVIGSLKEEIFNLLLQFIEEELEEFEQIIDNL